jgi:catalase
LLGDRGLPQGPRFTNGYGSHAYSLINAENERVWVKFHFKTQQGNKFFTNREAEAIVSKNRESFQKICSGPSNNATFPSGSSSSKSCRQPMLASTGTIRST